MGYIYKNIKNVTSELLLNRSDFDKKPIQNITICNTYTDTVKVGLYFYYYELVSDPNRTGETPTESRDWTKIEREETYYIIKNVEIPVGTTFKLDKEDILFDDTNPRYILYLVIDNSSHTVDVIIKI